MKNDNNKTRLYDKEVYEYMEYALKDENPEIQKLADSGLSFSVNSENIPERFFIRDGEETSTVNSVEFNIFGNIVKLNIRNIKQKLPNGVFKEVRVIEGMEASDYFKSSVDVLDLASIILDTQIIARVIYPAKTGNTLEDLLGESYALSYEGLLVSTNPAKQVDYIHETDFTRMIKGLSVLLVNKTKKIFQEIGDVISNNRGASSDEDRKRMAMSRGIGEVETVDYNNDGTPVTVNLNSGVVNRNAPTFSNVMRNRYSNGRNDNMTASVDIPQAEVKDSSTDAKRGKLKINK